jgi:hypothetical protein
MAKKLALVVHGIGEQQAGETLDALVGGLTGDHPCVVENELRHLRERDRDHPEDKDDRDKNLYPCHIRRVKQGNDETIFAEAFWGDISRGSNGQVRGLIELFKLIMGLGHIVRENAAEIYDKTNAFPRRAANFFVYLIHGPITGLNIALALAVAYLFLIQWQFGRVDWAGSGAILSTAATLLLGWAVLKSSGESYLYQIFRNWLALSAVILVAIVGASHAVDALFDEPQKAEFAVLLGSRCEAGTAFTTCYDYWYSAILSFILALCWGICVSIVVVTGGIETIRRLNKGKNASKALYPQTLTLMLTMWMLIVVIMWVAVSEAVVKIAITYKLETVNIAVMEKGMLPALNFIYFVSIALGVIAVCVVVAWADRKIWTSRFGAELQNDRDIRRLILHPAILLGLTLAIGIIALGAWHTSDVHFSIVAVEKQVASMALPQDMKNEIVKYKEQGYNIPQKFLTALAVIASLLVMSYTYFRQYLAMGIGIAKDIVVYFVRRPGPRVTDLRGLNVHPMRNRIQDRLVDTLILLLRSEQPDEVVIVSHSQGTVISVEALRGGRFRARLQAEGVKPCNVDLVTMGSPTCHLYGFYFAKEFDLKSTEPSHDVTDGIASWVNIYRLDDFVGMRVEGPAADFPINEWVPAKGHTNYWTDDSVLRHLKKHTFSEFSAREV